MNIEQNMTKKEQDTEDKIKEAARKVFQEKGFAGTKTRDIAEEAGLNLALLNYYFRSKKKLFDIIMLETLQVFFSGITAVMHDEETSLREKLVVFVDQYIDMFSTNQNMPFFMLNTVRENPHEYFERLGLLETTRNSAFIGQFQEAMMKGELPALNPLHFVLNIMGLVIFPFIAQPMVAEATGMDKELYFEMVQERKRLIPMWIDAMLKVE